MQNLDLEQLRQERLKCLEWKNIKPYWEAIASLPSFKLAEVNLADTVTIKFEGKLSEADEAYIYETAKLMHPWRKGPFQISTTHIDSEWRSNLKYNLLRPHFNLKDKVVGDIGCNNGYYLFKMMEDEPKRLVGFDPSAVTYCQFKFLNHFIGSNITYELLGVEHVQYYEHKFDVLFCLGYRWKDINTANNFISSFKIKRTHCQMQCSCSTGCSKCIVTTNKILDSIFQFLNFPII
jgi:tRNA (mo5U34)-methyltransferase